MVKYANGKIYKIVNSRDSQIYVGSTTKKYLCQRMGEHRAKAVTFPSRPLYVHMNRLGTDKFKIILLEDYAATSKASLKAREQHYIDQLRPALNSASAVMEGGTARRR